MTVPSIPALQLLAVSAKELKSISRTSLRVSLGNSTIHLLSIMLVIAHVWHFALTTMH